MRRDEAVLVLDPALVLADARLTRGREGGKEGGREGGRGEGLSLECLALVPADARLTRGGEGGREGGREGGQVRVSLLRV